MHNDNLKVTELEFFSCAIAVSFNSEIQTLTMKLSPGNFKSSMINTVSVIF